MNKWLVYMIFTLILIPCLSSSAIHLNNNFNIHKHFAMRTNLAITASADTTPNKNKQQKPQDPEDKKKIKEVAKAKRLPKPEKVDDNGTTNGQKTKPKRQRRPPGMERPPEIPRRNGN